MGLDTTHGCWHGAYSAFHRWRTAVAKAAGIPLPLMEAFWGDKDSIAQVAAKHLPTTSAFSPSPEGGMMATKTSLMTALSERLAAGDAGILATEWAEIASWLPIKWSSLKPDPLHVLLHHSDCDGSIEAKDCGPLADRLEELLPEIGTGQDPWGHIGDWKVKTQTFIDGLRRAAAANEDVEFR